MYPFTKFQLIWRTLDFGTKFSQQDINGKNFEKINIKFKIPIYPCTNFSQFENFRFWEQIFPQNTLGWSIRTKAT